MLSRWDMVLYIELFQNSDKVMYKTLRISNYKNIKKERTSKAESLMQRSPYPETPPHAQYPNSSILVSQNGHRSSS
jgi:hypothetical protein